VSISASDSIEGSSGITMCPSVLFTARTCPGTSSPARKLDTTADSSTCLDEVPDRRFDIARTAIGAAPQLTLPDKTVTDEELISGSSRASPARRTSLRTGFAVGSG
jgi:hypothetical protein